MRQINGAVPGGANQSVPKLLLLGDSTVGKSSLLLRFTEGHFEPEMLGSNGIDFRLKTFDFGGQKQSFQIWDTAGQERYRAIAVQFYRGAQGVLLVYDTANENTFKGIRSWIRSLNQTAQRSIKMVLVGNKCDLKEDRQVETEQGKALAEELGVDFFETSAKTGNGVEACFMHLARQVMEGRDNNSNAINEQEQLPNPSPPCDCLI